MNNIDFYSLTTWLWIYVGVSLCWTLYMAGVMAWEDIDVRFFNPWKRNTMKFSSNYGTSIGYIILLGTLPFINLIIVFSVWILPPIATVFAKTKLGKHFRAVLDSRYEARQVEITINRLNPFPDATNETQQRVRDLINDCSILFPDGCRFTIKGEESLVLETRDGRVFSRAPIGYEKYLLSQIVILELKLLREQEKGK